MSAEIVKICGLTSLADAEISLDAGASAIGVILSPHSPRFVDLELAREVATAAHGRALSVGVFLGVSEDDIVESLTRTGLAAAQIYDATSETLRARLAELGVTVIDARRGPSAPPALPGASYVLLDGARPGSGERWDLERSTVSSFETPVIVAGGLTPDNVAGVIEALAPAGVDCASGVESSPGVKDPARVANFVSAARDAFERLRGAS